MSTNPVSPHSKTTLHNSLQSSSAYESLRDLLESLSREQSRNQELLSSICFALRNFTNLNRFLELVPVVASRLVGVEGSLLVPFHLDGRIWKDQIHSISGDLSEKLIKQFCEFPQGQICGFASDEKQLLLMDSLVQRNLANAGIFVTSLVARGKQLGRLYVFEPKSPLVWSDINRRHIQIIADLAAVAIENDFFYPRDTST